MNPALDRHQHHDLYSKYCHKGLKDGEISTVLGEYGKNGPVSDFVRAQVEHHLAVAFGDQTFQNVPEAGHRFLSGRNISG